MMLELLLTRLQERKIRDAIYNNLRFLVFDELHTYRGRALDNVFIQRLWRSLKYELIYPGDFATGRDLFPALEDYFHFYNYASYCPPRYVIDKSKRPWSGVANTGSRLCRRLRSTKCDEAAESSQRRFRTHGPSGSGCSASISPRSIARRSVMPLTPTSVAASVRLSHPPVPSDARCQRPRVQLVPEPRWAITSRFCAFVEPGLAARSPATGVKP